MPRSIALVIGISLAERGILVETRSISMAISLAEKDNSITMGIGEKLKVKEKSKREIEGGK